jgi:hypothetical protein
MPTISDSIEKYTNIYKSVMAKKTLMEQTKSIIWLLEATIRLDNHLGGEHIGGHYQ